MGLFLALAYDSSVWQISTSGSTRSWTSSPNWGWTQSSPAGALTYQVTTYDCLHPGKQQYDSYAYIDPAGTSHPFPVMEVLGGTCPKMHVEVLKIHSIESIPSKRAKLRKAS